MFLNKMVLFIKSKKTKIYLGSLFGLALLFGLFSYFSKTYALSSGPLTVVNTDDSGNRYDGLVMGDLSMSGDASMVAIQVSTQSAASEIGINTSGNGNLIFLKNMDTGAFDLVSKTPTGEAANGSNSGPEISNDGRFVAFQSNSTNIIDGVNLNGLIKVYLYDNQTGQIEWISKNADGTQPGTWASRPSISGDGRYISYHSGSRTIVPYSGATTQHVFVYDRENDETQIVSINNSGVRGNGINRNSSISSDGRFVAFESLSTNLSPNDNNNYYDIYVYDRQNQTIELISKNLSGNASNGISTDPVISGDGRFVSFISSGTDIVSGYFMSNQTSNIYLYDRQEGVMNVVNLNNQGSLIGSSDSPAISGNGRYVAFTSFMGNQVPLQYLRDVVEGETFLMTETIDGNFPVGSSQRYGNSISSDGRYTSFITGTRVIFPGINSGVTAYIYDRDYYLNQEPPPPPPPVTTNCSNISSETSALVSGFGFMGVNIENGSDESQGGGGWIKFGCEQGENNFGVSLNVDENSSGYGKLSGNAWSNNYGWLSFEDDIVESCWENAPSETASSVARVLLDDSGDVVPVVGWARFINGMDSEIDGYSGCVSFSGSNYSVGVNKQSGALTGWAWGSDVVGWLSFQNPECPFCDAEIDLPEEDEEVEDVICNDPSAVNFNEAGECVYSEPVLGCMDSSATNYNSLATQDDGSCEYGSSGPSTNLSLSVAPISFTIGEPNLGASFSATNISWSSNNPSDIYPNSCLASFEIQSGGFTQTSNLPGWTGQLSDPNSSIFNVLIPQADSASAGTQFIFTINCQTLDGQDLQAEDTIIMTSNPVGGVTPTLLLRITDPNINPTLFNRETLGPSGSMVTIDWQATNVDYSTCQTTSVQFNPTSGNPEGQNQQWNSLSGNITGDGDTTVNMLVQGIGNGMSTNFRMTCQSIDGINSVSSEVRVCLQDMQCPSFAGSGIPNFQEF